MTKNVPAGKATIETGVYDRTAAGIKKIKQRFKKMSASLRRYSQQAALGAASIGAPLVLAAKQFVTIGDKIDKLSKRTNLSTDAAQSFGFAMEQSGSSMDALEPAIRALNRNFLDMKRGSKEATDNFGSLGIGLGQLEELDTADRFRLIVKQLEQIPDAGERAAVAAKVLGKSGTAVLPLLGSLGKLEDEFNSLGDSMTKEQVAAAAELSDSFNKLKRAFQAIVVNIGSALAPALTKLTNDFLPITKQAIEFVKNNKKMVIGVAKLATVIGTLAVAMRALSLINPWTATLAGIALVISELDEFKALIDRLVAKAAGLKQKEKKDAPGLRELVNSKEFQKTREEVTRNEDRDKERKLSPEDFAKKMLEKANKAAGSQQFKTMSSRFNSVLKNAASAVANIAENVPQVAASALGVAGNFLQANTMQPALMASTAGGLGAGGALGIGALGGATTPMQDVSENTANISDGIEMMNEKLADLVGNGLDVQVINTEEIKNG